MHRNLFLLSLGLTLACRDKDAEDTAATRSDADTDADTAADTDTDTDADTDADTDTDVDVDYTVSGRGWGCSGGVVAIDAWSTPAGAPRVTVDLVRTGDGSNWSETHPLLVADTTDAEDHWAAELEPVSDESAYAEGTATLFACSDDWEELWTARWTVFDAAGNADDCLVDGANPDVFAADNCSR